MTLDEFVTWGLEYRARFLRPNENYDFISAWEREMLGVELVDAREAMNSVDKDLRDVARYPIRHLHLLLEYAAFHASERNRSKRPKTTWGPKPTPGELWDRRMVQIGAIDQAEFERRAEMRRAESQGVCG